MGKKLLTLLPRKIIDTIYEISELSKVILCNSYGQVGIGSDLLPILLGRDSL
jgi:hypothetical protein